jgi:hypothetical protein
MKMGYVWYSSRLLRVKAVPLVAPNGAVLGVTHINEGQQGIKKPFLNHGFDRGSVLLSETGGIFMATYGLN